MFTLKVPDTTGGLIKQFRTGRKITQKELATLSQVSSKSIERYENGGRIPPADVLQRIANALNVSVEAILPRSPFDAFIDVSLKEMERARKLFGKHLEEDELYLKLAAHEQKIDEIIYYFDELNENGHKELLDYIITLTNMPKYKLSKK